MKRCPIRNMNSGLCLEQTPNGRGLKTGKRIPPAIGLQVVSDRHILFQPSIANPSDPSSFREWQWWKTVPEFLSKEIPLPLSSPPTQHTHPSSFSFSLLNSCQRRWKFWVWVPGWSEVTGKLRQASALYSGEPGCSVTWKAFRNLLLPLSLKAWAISIFWFRVTIEKLYNSSSGIRRYICNKNC